MSARVSADGRELGDRHSRASKIDMLASPDCELDAFAACAPGLEALLEHELSALGYAGLRAVVGGVEFRSSYAGLWRCNLHTGLALRVFARVARFPVRHMARLERWAKRANWVDWLPRGFAEQIQVVAHTRRSKLMHTAAIADRVRSAIDLQLGSGGALPAQGELPSIHLRLERDLCTVSLDCSGTTLNKRGWRTMTPRAPLREDIARALLYASGWPGDGDPDTGSLVDPMCGSGTLAIEAATMLCGRAPGIARSFAFEATPAFDVELWRELQAKARESELSVAGRVYGLERDGDVLELARANAKQAGVGECVQWREATLDANSARRPPASSGEPWWIMVNPPWGRRMAAVDTDTMKALGQLVRSCGGGARTGIVATQRKLVDATRLKFARRLATDCGGTRVTLHLSGVRDACI